MDESMELTAANRRLTLTVCFNYGGRAEIIDAVRQLVAEGVAPEKIDEKALRARLYWPDMPDPDVVIRTSGEFRISNFLLWELPYSELVFTDVLWPDFRRQNLFDAVGEYQRRDRRYGGVHVEGAGGRARSADPRPHRSDSGLFLGFIGLVFLVMLAVHGATSPLSPFWWRLSSSGSLISLGARMRT